MPESAVGFFGELVQHNLRDVVKGNIKRGDFDREINERVALPCGLPI